jgi:hypothetical protein
LGETEIWSRLQSREPAGRGAWRSAKIHFGRGRLRQGVKCLIKGCLARV